MHALFVAFSVSFTAVAFAYPHAEAQGNALEVLCAALPNAADCPTAAAAQPGDGVVVTTYTPGGGVTTMVTYVTVNDPPSAPTIYTTVYV